MSDDQSSADGGADGGAASATPPDMSSAPDVQAAVAAQSPDAVASWLGITAPTQE